MPLLPTSVRCPSVHCCLSRGHISKTKQNRLIVTMEHQATRTLALLILFLHSDFPQTSPRKTFCLERYSDFKYKLYSNIRPNTVRLGFRSQLLSTEPDRHHTTFHILIFLFIPCGRLSWLPVSFLVHVKYAVSYRSNHRPLNLHHRYYDAKVERDAGQLFSQ